MICTSKTIKAYRSLFVIRVAENLQYRAAAIINSSVGIFWSIMQIVVFTIFFTFGDVGEASMTLPQAITYAWFAQVLWRLTGWLSLDTDIRGKIIGGNVALDLCRPMDLYTHWYAQTIANRVGGAAWRIVVTLGTALIVPAALRLLPPASLAGFLLFIVSVCIGVFLCAAFAMLMAAVRVGLTWGDGPTYMLEMIGMFLNGSYFPLALWPDFMQRFLLLQPFAGLMDIPIRLYIGLLLPQDAVWVIGLQIFWAIAFVVVGKHILHRRICQLIVQGG